MSEISKKLYHYSRDTREFFGVTDGRLDPRDGHLMVPANATETPTDAPPENKNYVFDGTAWNEVDDYRGQVFYTTTGDKVTIEDLGVTPDDAWLTEPPPPTDLQVWEEEIAALDKYMSRDLERVMTAQGTERYDDFIIAKYNEKITLRNNKPSE